jgi:hypothetical protein
MKNSLHLSIPQPCHEDWDKMNPTEQGMFCNVCSKCVVDFTQFSDDELLAYFSRAPKNVCGRFDSTQLNKTITQTPVYSPWFTFPKKWMVAAGLWIGLLAKGIAQTATTDSLTAQQEIATPLQHQATTTDTTRRLTGIVVDSTTNEALSGVMIVIAGTPLGAYTDANGEFSMLLPKEYADKTISLKLQYIGYETSFFNVQPNGDNITLKLDGSDIIMMKEVVVVSNTRFSREEHVVGALPANYFNTGKQAHFYNKKRTRWQRLKDFFRDLF